MRKKRGLIVLAVCLVVLIGSYAVLSQLNKDEEEPDDTPSKIEISKLEIDDIVEIKLTNEDGEFVFKKVTDKASDDEEKETYKWICLKPGDLNLNQNHIDNIGRTFSSLAADLLVEEEAEDLSIYGLKTPQAVAEAKLKDGSTVTLRLGNKTASGESYYLMKDGDKSVYTVASFHGNRMIFTKSDIRDKDLPKINLLAMDYLYMYRQGHDEEEIEVVPREISEDGVQYGLSIYDLVKPYKRARGIDNAKLTKDMAVLESGLKIKDYIEDDVEDLAKYGLEDPAMHLIIKDKENQLELFLGDAVDDETIYAKTGDSNTVFTLNKSDMEFMDIKTMDFIERFALIINIEHVDSVVAELEGKSYDLSIKRRTAKNEEGEEELIETFFLNGEEKPESPFRKAYQALISMMVDMHQENTAQGDPVLRISYKLNRGDQREELVELYPHDKDFYVLSHNGEKESEFLVGVNRVETLKGHLDKLEEAQLDEE